MPSFGFSYTVRLTEDQLQAQIDTIMPIEKKQLMTTIRIFEPQLELVPDTNQIGIAVSLEAIAPGGLKGAAHGRLLGSIRYEKEQGAFYISDPELAHLHFKRVPDSLNKEITRVVQLALVQALNRYPVYRFNDKDGRQKMAKSMLESVTVDDEVLLIKLKPF